LRRAKKGLLRVIELDPNFADAYVILARNKLLQLVSTGNVLFKPEDLPTYLSEIEALIGKGLELAPDNANAYNWLGGLVFMVPLGF